MSADWACLWCLKLTYDYPLSLKAPLSFKDLTWYMVTGRIMLISREAKKRTNISIGIIKGREHLIIYCAIFYFHFFAQYILYIYTIDFIFYITFFTRYIDTCYTLSYDFIGNTSFLQCSLKLFFSHLMIF